MFVAGGSTDVTTYFAMRLTADGAAATGLTITDFDLQYVRSGVAPVAKVDATALAATDSDHADNKAIEIDATDQPGLYRVDWPDAAFVADVREVILSVKVATAFTEHLRVEIDAPVSGFTIGPLVASVTPANLVGSPAELQGFQLAAQDYVLTVLDADDDPVDLSGKTLQFHVETLSDKSDTQFTVAAGSIVVSGGSNQIATISVTAVNTAIAADTYRWRLIDIAADDVLVFGNYVLLASTDGS